MTASESGPEAPGSLGERGRAYWAAIVSDFALSTSETEILVEVCRTLDVLESLAGDPESLTEARLQRLVLHRLIAALDLPEEEAPESAATTRARHAANARWASTADLRERRRRGTA